MFFPAGLIYFGWPCSIRSDGGPQFRGDFIAFCYKSNIKHKLSSPYNPCFNGLAKSGVKIVNNILKKCFDNGVPESAFYEWKNLPGDHGYSPAQLMFGRRQCIALPMPESAFSQVDFEKAALEKDEKFSAQTENYNKGKVDLPMLLVGQVVRIQEDKTKPVYGLQ